MNEIQVKKIQVVEIRQKTGLPGPKGNDGYTPIKGVDYFDGAQGPKGTDGLSVYEIAVANGFNGTEQEWLVSLKNEIAQILIDMGIGIVPDQPEVESFILGNFSLYEPPIASNEWVTDSTGRILNISDTQFLSLFYDNYVGTQPDGMIITKTSLGLDESGTYNIYEYDFKPKNYKETILLSSGMHTYELSASFGLAHFVSSMMMTPYAHEGFEYIRKNVRVKIIPIINPWGFNQSPKKYGNVNGVNPNRNFDYDGSWEAYPSLPNDEWNYKGTAPFSENETQILRDWALNNQGAKFWIDCHTAIGDGGWDNFIYHMSNTPLRPQIEYTLSKLEERIKTKYNKLTPTRQVIIDSSGSVRQPWSQYIAGIPTFTIEQSPSNLLWGTKLNNESGDITEYAMTISAYVFTFLTSAPFLTTKNSSIEIPSEINPVINYTIYDNDIEDTFTATYTIDGNSTIASNLSAGANTWSGDLLDVGEHTLTITATDKNNINSNTLYFNITVLSSLTGEIIISDSFNRADSDTLGVTDVGNAQWTLDASASYKISSNKAMSNTAYSTNTVFLETGISDFEVSVDIEWDVYGALVFRRYDDRNKIMARINGTSLGLYTYNNSINGTLLGTYEFTPVKGELYNLKAVCNGATILVYLNDVLRVSASSEYNMNRTMVGIRTSADTTSTFDNFVVKTLS